jgi:hypothetical protein
LNVVLPGSTLDKLFHLQRIRGVSDEGKKGEVNKNAIPSMTGLIRDLIEEAHKREVVR